MDCIGSARGFMKPDSWMVFFPQKAEFLNEILSKLSILYRKNGSKQLK